MNKKHWSICQPCQGQGQTLQGPSRRVHHRYKRELEAFKKGFQDIEPKKPKQNLDICSVCIGSGLSLSETKVSINPHYPKLAIIGGGIGGTALAVACLHRGIPFTLYERDRSFDARAQGYGLTLQQASKAVHALGIESLHQGIISTRHVVHTPDGNIIGEWGLRKWLGKSENETDKRKNIHISRQSLRLELLNQLGDLQSIKWGHKFIDYSKNKDTGFNIEFEVGEKKKIESADLIVGADGIRSSVRKLVIGKDKTPLKYLNCFVMLGICSLTSLGDLESPLLDSATVFQTVNGRERIYMMPYDKDSIMWQLSFPMGEFEAKELNKKGSIAMKQEVLKRLQNWHEPIPQILKATDESKITGYPVYDRDILDPELFHSSGNTTLIGDAAHPMSPFKGQGANQAILDALDLVRKISTECDVDSNWREHGLRNLILSNFEQGMIQRTKSKVEGSRKAVELLHSDAVLQKRDGPRGR